MDASAYMDYGGENMAKQEPFRCFYQKLTLGNNLTLGYNWTRQDVDKYEKIVKMTAAAETARRREESGTSRHICGLNMSAALISKGPGPEYTYAFDAVSYVSLSRETQWFSFTLPDSQLVPGLGAVNLRSVEVAESLSRDDSLHHLIFSSFGGLHQQGNFIYTLGSQLRLDYPPSAIVWSSAPYKLQVHYNVPPAVFQLNSTARVQHRVRLLVRVQPVLDIRKLQRVNPSMRSRQIITEPSAGIENNQAPGRVKLNVQNIPPNVDFRLRLRCDLKCPTRNASMWAIFPHMHRYGRGFAVRHWPSLTAFRSSGPDSGTVLAEIRNMKESSYVYAVDPLRTLITNRSVLMVECDFSTRGADRTIGWGHSKDHDEMCLAFMYLNFSRLPLKPAWIACDTYSAVITKRYPPEQALESPQQV